MPDKITTDHAEIEMLNDEILSLRFLPKTDINLEIAKETVEASSKVSQNRMHANLVDMRKMIFMSNDARKYFAKQNKETVYAIAVIINSKLHRSFANLYLKINKPNIPTKMFDTEEEALKWLEEEKEKRGH